MKVGIVGTGKIVNRILEFTYEVKNMELVAICATERSKEKMKELALKHQIRKTYTNYDMMLSDPEIEVVYLGVPNDLHYEMAKQAMLKDKHVICEKPFTSTYDELLSLAKIANEKKLILLEAILTQYIPNMIKIKELIPSLGEVKIVTANYSQYSSRYDDFKKGIILPAFDYSKSGGALMDLNVYNIHFVVGLFGRPKAVRYMANIERNIDTSGILTLDYEDFKAVLIGAKDCKAPRSNCIQGDKGSIYFTTPTNLISDFVYAPNGEKEMAFNYNNNTNGFCYEFSAFADIIDNRDYRRANKMMQISLDVMEVVTLARMDANIRFPADNNK